LDVFVYSSSRKNGYYIYLAEKDNFEAIPESIRPGLGPLNYALTFELDKSRKLASEDPQQVMKNLVDNGFHLQISDPVLTSEKLRKLSGR